MAKFTAYPPLDSLVDLACRDGVDIRPTLLRVLTDLYVQKATHSADEERQYVELALGLIDAADEATRAAVKTRLSAYPTAPAPVLRKLNGFVEGQEDSNTAQARPNTNDLAELFFAAGTDERRLILANLVAADTYAPRQPRTASSEVLRRLEAAALQHNAGEFGRILERALGIDHDLAGRLVRDSSGEPLVVAAKALGMKAAVLQRILLMLNPAIGQSVQRVYDLAQLFDEITPEAADRMVAIWRDAVPRRPGSHASQSWDDEKRSARSLANPTAHRIGRRPDALRPQRKTGNEP